MNKRMAIVIEGSFHGAAITLRPEVTISARGWCTAWFSDAQIKKARRELCGIDGCMCGDGIIHNSMPVAVVDGSAVKLI